MPEIYDTWLYEFDNMSETEIRNLHPYQKEIIARKAVTALKTLSENASVYIDILEKLEDSSDKWPLDSEIRDVRGELDCFYSALNDYVDARGTTRDYLLPDVHPVACRFGTGMSINMEMELALRKGEFSKYSETEWEDYLGFNPRRKTELPDLRK